MIPVLIVLFIHLICFFIIYILKKTGRIRLSRPLMVQVLLLPVFGEIIALITAYMNRSGRAGYSGEKVEIMRKSAAEEIQSLELPNDNGDAVPLEDALIIDDTDTRRSAIMDVLMNGTGGYMHVLGEAQKNDDVEVVHYATTAMVEMSKNYEMKLQDYAVRHASAPDDIPLLSEYIDCLDSYLESGIVSGQMMRIHRSTYGKLLTEIVEKDPSKNNYCRLTECFLDTGEVDEADRLLNEMEDRFGDDDAIWLLRFRYYYETGSGNRIGEMIRRRNTGERYNSREIQEVLEMWGSGL